MHNLIIIIIIIIVGTFLLQGQGLDRLEPYEFLLSHIGKIASLFLPYKA